MATSKFTVGGVVQSDEAIYLHRDADDTLFGLCSQAIFAYVLAPRQMGKTSLMVRTARRLRERGVAYVIITLYETSVTADQWYLRLIADMVDQLDLRTDPQRWWQEHADRGRSQRFRLFLETVLLAEVTTPVVIFIDEIDLTLSFDFTDDFFSAIRSLYEERPRKPALERISFVLVGVASPSDLIHDPLHTPFNIGFPVEMTDFTLDQAGELAQGFIDYAPFDEARRVLAHILDWTHGHPYLTQRLCRALLDEMIDWDEAGVATLVQRILLGDKGANDPNLQEVRRMLTRRAADPYDALSTYRDILRGKRISDDAQSSVKALLKLSGLVRASESRLVVRNRIYREVFDTRWVREQMEQLPVYWPRRLQQMLRYMAYVLVLPLILVSVFAAYQWYLADGERHKADGAAKTAQSAAKTAQSAQNLEQFARQTADAARNQADAQRRDAQAAALALHALARFKDEPALSLRILRSAANLGWTPPVDQAVRQIVRPEPCVSLDRPVYGAAWSAVDEPNVLADPPEGDPAASEIPSPKLVVRQIDRVGHRVAVLSPDGRFLLVAAAEDVAQVLDAGTHEVRVELRGTGGAVLRAVWSPDGRRILTMAGTSTVRVWDATTGKPQFTLPGQGADMKSAVWSGDSRWIARASVDGVARVWSVDGEQSSTEHQIHVGTIDDLALRFDGSQLAAAYDDGIVKIWDVGSGAEAFTLAAGDGKVLAVRWSPRGRYILTVGADGTTRGTTRVWDAQKNKQITVLETKLPLAAAVWSADDRHFLIARADGVVCAHDTLEQLLESAPLKDVQPLPQDEEDRLVEDLLPTPIPSTSTETPTLQPADTPGRAEPYSVATVEPPARIYFDPTAPPAPSETPVPPTATTAEPTAATAEPTATTAAPAATTTATTSTADAGASQGRPPPAPPSSAPVDGGSAGTD